MMKRIARVLGIGALCLGVLAAAPPAQADLMEFLFPSLKNQKYDPTKTMKAPFADNPHEADAISSQTTVGVVPQEKIPVHLAHRSEQQIADWVMASVSTAMTFENTDFETDMQKKSQYFSAGALKQFSEFLTEHKLANAVQSQKYVVRAFVNGDPSLLNQGAVEGRYRWLFSAPVMISIMEAGLKDYRQAAQTASQEGTIQVQVGRVEKPGQNNPDGLVIEIWKGTLQPAKLN